MKDPKKVSAGKRSRTEGKAFETRVRADMESKGWIVDRWTNNVKDNKLVPAKAKYNPFTKSMMMGSGGLPDFIGYHVNKETGVAIVIGVESKIKGKLDKVEKEKCQWLIENNIFRYIFVAEKIKIKNKITIKYNKYGK